jgi:GNAT superfamily N-acetyltransferase
MTLRSAHLSDAPTLAVLATQLGYPTCSDEAEARLREVLALPGGAVLVAEDEDGSVIGWIHVFGAHRIEAAPFAEIAALVVDETRRGRGTGEWAERHGFHNLRVRSNTVRERTHAFYERLGFKRTKTQVSFAKPIGP